jgi:hypothetical protein
LRQLFAALEGWIEDDGGQPEMDACVKGSADRLGVDEAFVAVLVTL